MFLSLVENVDLSLRLWLRNHRNIILRLPIIALQYYWWIVGQIIICNKMIVISLIILQVLCLRYIFTIISYQQDIIIFNLFGLAKTIR